MKRKKKIKINYFNVLVLISCILSASLLLHDLLIWGIIPFFTGKFYMLSYLGLFIDITALFILESSIQVIKTWK